MLMRVAAVDDLPQDLLCLQQDLHLMSQGVELTSGFELEFSPYASASALLNDFAAGRFDLIFLDIMMDGVDGLEAAERIRQQDPHCLLVFVTSSPDYAWQSFPLHPFDYLLKPYQPQRLNQLVAEALRALSEPQPEIRLHLPHRDMTLPLHSIYYVMAENHHVLLMTPTGMVRTMGTFAAIEQELSRDDRFLMCNRGLIVNMEAVLHFEEDSIQMVDGRRFSMRLKGRNKLFNTFTQFQFRHMKKE